MTPTKQDSAEVVMRGYLREICFVSMIVLISGCGESSESQGVVGSNAQTSSNDTTAEAPLPAMARPIHLTDSEIVGSDPVADGMKVSAEAEVDPRSLAEDVPPPVVSRVVEPSSEQLAKWSRPTYEPLQLLACRDLVEIGLVTKVAAMPDGRQFVLGGNQVSLWSILGEAPEHVFLEPREGQLILSLGISPDQKLLVAGDSEGMLHVWSLIDRQLIGSKKLHDTGITDVAISPDSQEIATISFDNEIAVWSASELQPTSRFKVDTNGLRKLLYTTPELLVAAGESTSAWNVRTGQKAQVLSAGPYNYSLARSHDGTRIVLGDQAGLTFWNIQNSKPEGTLAGGFATDEEITFLGDGSLMATTNANAIRIWDPANRQLTQVIDAYGPAIAGTAWLAQSNVLVVVSAYGRVRVWGTLATGNALTLQPLHPPVDMPNANSDEVATSVQLLQLLDLRTFPSLLVGATGSGDPFQRTDVVSATVDEATQFYKYHFRSAGWDEVTATTPSPGSVSFQKAGFMLTGSFYDAGSSSTSVNLNLAGNYDLRRLPKCDAQPVEVLFENEYTVMYRTGGELFEIEAMLLRSMRDAGWIPYSRLHASQAEVEDRRDLEFLRNGLTLRVSIGRFPTDPTQYTIQYAGFLTRNSIPVPPDTSYIEFDGSTQPTLVAVTKMTLAETRTYFDQQMSDQGWLVKSYGGESKEDHVWLSYIWGQRDLIVALEQADTGETIIRVGESLEATSWQLAQRSPEEVPAPAAEGIEAADFPILNASKSAELDANVMSITFSMGEIPLADVARKYTGALAALGWTTDGSGVNSDEYVLVTFTKDKQEIDLRARLRDGNATVSVQGDGILWNKPLPGGKKVVSYATWLRTNHHPATLGLLDAYREVMKLIVRQ